jgi:hypothetical protein
VGFRDFVAKRLTSLRTSRVAAVVLVTLAAFTDLVAYSIAGLGRRRP